MIKKSGELELSLVKVPIPEPAADEVVVRVEATPINPSDLGLLLGAADLKTAKLSGTNDVPVVIATVHESAMKAMAGRLDASMPVGNEGAGVVVKAGASDAAQTLLGKTVAMIGGAMYAQYRCLKAADCLVLAAGTTPTEGASCFVNPLTSLGMVETMRREGHKALVHTAAASNLGQMLNKICLKDQVALVNIVRTSQQEDIATNMPGEVARTSTFALSNVTTSFVLALADKGLRRALNEDLHLRDGLNVHNGRITYRAVADALKLPYTDANQVLRI